MSLKLPVQINNFYYRSQDKLPDHDYQKLDKQFSVTFKEDRYQEIKKLGFQYISEATVELYRQYKSMGIVAHILNMDPVAIGQRLRRYKEPRRGPGSLPGKTHELKKQKYYL